MGCYDSILLPCPKCGELYEAQSKSGDCLLRIYDFENTPEDVESKVESKELIKKIFDLCQSTPEYREGKDATQEALRLDKTIAEINSLCDVFIYKHKNDPTT